MQRPLRQNRNVQQSNFHHLSQVTRYGRCVGAVWRQDLTRTGSADAQVSQVGSEISGTVGATQGWECGFLRI